MKTKGIFFTLLLAGGIVGVFKFYEIRSDFSQDGGSEVLTDEAAFRDLESVVTATGEVLPKMSSVVKSELSGRIVSIYVEEGEEVSRGDLLLELERTSFEARVNEAQRSLEAEKLRLNRAERNFIRQEELFNKDFVGEQAFFDAQTDFELAQLNLEISQARLEDAEEELSKTKINAPHDGVVTKLDVTEGQVISGATSVSNGTDLMTVAQLRQLYLEANINEVDVERLKLGQEARLRFDAIKGYRLTGEVGVIALSARKDGEVRVFPIEVLFEATDGRVRPGISATVDIPVGRSEGAVSVLLSAVFQENEEDQPVVYLKNGDVWEEAAVEVGMNDLQYVEILSGLEPGEIVALSRPKGFRNDRND